ncbi:MAG: MipA/OmpV family protein [Kiritimatiellia bacterium]
MNRFCRLCALFGLCSGPLFAQAPATVRPSPWSAGVFFLTDSQPYEGAGSSTRVFPTVSYRGERLQWNGPSLQYKLIEKSNWSLSPHLLVSFAPYEEDDAPILEGMGDRSDTLLAGVDWNYRPIPPLTLLASLDAEIFGAFNGVQATLGMRYALGKPWERLSGSVGAGLLLQNQEWTRYFVGVPAAKATEERPAHSPGESFHPYTSAQLLFQLYKNWSWFTLARVEFLDETWRDSPLIADSYRLLAFTTIQYSF